jgi:hypothetical protein
VRARLSTRISPTPLFFVAAIFLSYTVVRLAALAYVAVFFGHFDERLVFATHSFLLLIGPFVIADAFAAMRAAKGPGSPAQPTTSPSAVV